MHPINIRKIACHVYSIIKSLRKTECLLSVSRSSISRWLHGIDKKPYTKRSTGYKSDMIVDIVKSTIQCNPLTSISQLQIMLSESISISVSKQLIRTVIKSFGFSRKKARFCGRPANQSSKIQEFISKRNDVISRDKYIVSIDETSFGRHSYDHVMGYSPVGTPLYISKKLPRMTTTSVVACMSANGMVGMSSIVNKSFDTTSFLEFLITLNLPRNTVIFLDNVSFHHSKVIKNFARDNDIDLLYTPPYCPWFNPIEYGFSIVKRYFVKSQNITESFRALCPWHCRSFFKKSLSCDGQNMNFCAT